jgi:hypothetical protein
MGSRPGKAGRVRVAEVRAGDGGDLRRRRQHRVRSDERDGVPGRGHLSDGRRQGEIDHQISDKKIKVYVYNPQNATPHVQSQVNAAMAAGVPVTTMTMTMTMVPADATWQEWQTRRLGALRDALAKATGR